MRPRKPDGQMWNPQDSNIMLQHFSRQATAELSERDIARGLPRSLSCMATDDGGRTFYVDPHLSHIKHSGVEKTKLMLGYWHEFCGEPRDPAACLAEIGVVASAVEFNPLSGIPDAISMAIEKGIAAGIAAMAATNNGQDKEPRRARKTEPIAVGEQK